MEGKNLSAASRKSKTISSLDTPYTHVQWPVVSADDQTKILDMLCRQVFPNRNKGKMPDCLDQFCFDFATLIQHDREHTLPPMSRNVASSKGKRAKKRKREDDPIVKDRQAAFSKGRLARTSALAQPEIHDHLTVGFNTTTRYLERLAQKVSPSTEKDEIPGTVVAMETSARPCLNPANIKPLAAVFVPRSGQPPVLYSHLPLLTKAASLAVPSSPSTRIISLPEGTEAQLKTVLGIPRVGMVGLIDGAPDASSLIELIRQDVPELEVPWFQEAVKGAYLAVKINTVQTGAPLNPKRGARSSILAMAPDDGMWYDKRR